MDVAKGYEYEIIQREVMPDHIHIFVSAKPTVAPIDIVSVFKSITAIELFKKYPKLKSFCGRYRHYHFEYEDGSESSDSYFEIDTDYSEPMFGVAYKF